MVTNSILKARLKRFVQAEATSKGDDDDVTRIQTVIKPQEYFLEARLKKKLIRK